MFRLNFIFILSIFGFAAKAQTLNLQQCIDSAITNNIGVKQSELIAENSGVLFQQSRNDLLPFVNADVYHGLSQGRSIDPSSNGYVNQQLGFANYQLGAGVTLFNGGSLRYAIRENATAFEAARLETQQQKDNLVLNVIIAYLQVLNNEDILQSALNQAAVSSKEVERLTILNEQGAIRPSDFSDMKGQLMNDQLSIVDAKNRVESAKLLLLQLMNKPYDPSIKLERVDQAEFLTAYGNSVNDVYQNALQQFAEIKAVELRKKSYEYALRSVRGGLYPTVTIGGGWNSAYSSTAQNASGKIAYTSQLKNNISTSAGVGISIPIFNRFATRSRIKQADILVRSAGLQEEATKLNLRQQIDQAWLNMNNAYDRYKLLLDQVNAYEDSYKAAEARFNEGVGTSYDYLVAKDRFDRARLNLITAKYDFVLRKRVLDYYNSSK
jgi:outer membrane protein